MHKNRVRTGFLVATFFFSDRLCLLEMSTCMAPLREGFLVSVGSTAGSFPEVLLQSTWMRSVGIVLLVTWWQNGPTASQSWDGKLAPRAGGKCTSSMLKMPSRVEPTAKVATVVLATST